MCAGNMCSKASSLLFNLLLLLFTFVLVISIAHAQDAAVRGEGLVKCVPREKARLLNGTRRLGLQQSNINIVKELFEIIDKVKMVTDATDVVVAAVKECIRHGCVVARPSLRCDPNANKACPLCCEIPALMCFIGCYADYPCGFCDLCFAADGPTSPMPSTSPKELESKLTRAIRHWAYAVLVILGVVWLCKVCRS